MVVQMLNPGSSKTFQEYADNVFSPYVSSQLAIAQRVYLVWDVQIADNLKNYKKITRKRQEKACYFLHNDFQKVERLCSGRLK